MSLRMAIRRFWQKLIHRSRPAPMCPIDNTVCEMRKHQQQDDALREYAEGRAEHIRQLARDYDRQLDIWLGQHRKDHAPPRSSH